MSREKQIEEMELTEVDILANDLNQHCADLAETYCGDTNCLACLAHALTAKGYRKRSEGEWLKFRLSADDTANRWKCSVCKTEQHEETDYCPNCGAKMKGGE